MDAGRAGAWALGARGHGLPHEAARWARGAGGRVDVWALGVRTCQLAGARARGKLAGWYAWGWRADGAREQFAGVRVGGCAR